MLIFTPTDTVNMALVKHLGAVGTEGEAEMTIVADRVALYKSKDLKQIQQVMRDIQRSWAANITYIQINKDGTVT